jgi:hypothetical protein
LSRNVEDGVPIRTAGTAAAPPAVNHDTAGWGVAAHARVPMRRLSEWFSADQLSGMIYYGKGIGRYFADNSSGQDLLTNLGLPGAGTDFTQNALETYGATIAYRHFWVPEVRSTVAYSYAQQNYPSYVLAFIPGSVSATSLNNEMQQGIANLIWSPFATARNGTVDTGWLDAGLEYVYTRRNVYGGAASTLPTGAGYGIANRFLAAATLRF